MPRNTRWVLIALALLAAAWFWWRGAAPTPLPAGDAPVITAPTTAPPASFPRERLPQTDDLPRQAHETLRRIHAGGPFDYRQDGGTFQNRERLLPRRERGWYREYTVDTPGSRDRGARRIVTGGDPPSEFWYTDDHYRSFQRIGDAAERAR